MARHIHVHVHTSDGVWSESDHPRASDGKFGKAEHLAAADSHRQRKDAHAAKGKELGEDDAQPPRDSHSAAASHHGAAEFYHKKAAEALDPEYVKKAHRATSIAEGASKKVAKAESSGTYTGEKKNDANLGDGLTPQQRAAKRSNAYLKQKWVKK